MTLITDVSDPTLHAKLVEEVNKYEKPSGWVVYLHIHYKVLQTSSGDLAFEEYDSQETAKSTSF
jgi:hypothetical protein